MSAVPATAADKAFATLAAQYALAGYALIRELATNGTVSYYCTRWGYLKPLADLDAARAHLPEIGGAR